MKNSKIIKQGLDKIGFGDLWWRERTLCMAKSAKWKKNRGNFLMNFLKTLEWLGLQESDLDQVERGYFRLV